MTAVDRLDEIQARYVEWHEDGRGYVSDPDLWADRDGGESMEHCIVRNDVPAMHAALRAVLSVCDMALAVKVLGSSQADAAVAATVSVIREEIAAALGVAS